MARPRKISDEDVLSAAMLVFCRDGYAGTSLSDLEQAVGLNRRGLANRFGDKKGLLVEALRAYEGRAHAAFLSRLDTPAGAPGAGLAAIRAMFRAILAYRETEAGRFGCMMVNLSRDSVAEDPEVQARFQSYFETLTHGFAAALAAASAQGELAEGEDPEALRAFLLGCVMGLFSLIRAGAPPEMLEGFTETALQRLGPETRPGGVLHS